MSILEQVKSILSEENNIMIASVDKEKSPNISVIDKIIFDNDSFYFYLKDHGQLFKDLKKNNKIVLYLETEKYQLKIKAETKILDKTKKKVFIKNNIFEDAKLETIKLKKIVGEITSLTTNKLEKFSFNKTKENNLIYQINKNCETCNKCYKACPVDAISKGKKQYKINPLKCIGCGKCFKVCPYNAIDKSLNT